VLSIELGVTPCFLFELSCHGANHLSSMWISVRRSQFVSAVLRCEVLCGRTTVVASFGANKRRRESAGGTGWLLQICKDGMILYMLTHASLSVLVNMDIVKYSSVLQGEH
jgi:hypothetical protein